MTYTITSRHRGDGHVRDDVDWKQACVLTIYGEDPSRSKIGLSEYPYGMMIFFQHPCNQLEIHAHREAEGGYSALATFVAQAKANEFQLRQKGDTNSVTINYPEGKNAIPVISTEFQNTDLRIAPKGKLLLDSDVWINGEPLEDFISRVVRTNV